MKKIKLITSNDNLEQAELCNRRFMPIVGFIRSVNNLAKAAHSSAKIIDDFSRQLANLKETRTGFTILGVGFNKTYIFDDWSHLSVFMLVNKTYIAFTSNMPDGKLKTKFCVIIKTKTNERRN